jgi:hypothetical protein
MRLVPLKSLSPWLSVHMYNVQNGGPMQYRRQFEYDVVLNSELDSNSAISSWIGLQPSRARLLDSPAPY